MNFLLILFTSLVGGGGTNEFCKDYQAYVQNLGAYAIIDGQAVVRDLSPGELYDLSQLRKHMHDARVHCD